MRYLIFRCIFRPREALLAGIRLACGSGRWAKMASGGLAASISRSVLRSMSDAQKRERQLVALGETTMADGIVATDTPHLRTECLQLAMGIPEAASLCGATRGVVFRIEKQHQDGSVAVPDVADVAVLILTADRGGAVTNSERHLLGLNIETAP